MQRAVGIFDSGVGGFSVWREIVQQLPYESTVYFADQVHVPYGPRPADEIRAFADEITRFLLAQDCKAVVVACNTASAVALRFLRERFPQVPFVGLEPAVKPAVAMTRSAVVGIMATPATFEGELFRATVGRHGAGIRLVNQICAGLAEQVEAGQFDSAETEAMLRGFVQPMLDAGADTIVLGCTHYPFVMDILRRVAGPGVRVIDPAPAVARQLQRVLVKHGLAAGGSARTKHCFHTSAQASDLALLMPRLLGAEMPADAEVLQARWRQGQLLAPATAQRRSAA
jgi:glutamate racemase